jgi:hypothetical protein
LTSAIPISDSNRGIGRREQYLRKQQRNKQRGDWIVKVYIDSVINWVEKRAAQQSNKETGRFDRCKFDVPARMHGQDIAKSNFVGDRRRANRSATWWLHPDDPLAAGLLREANPISEPHGACDGADGADSADSDNNNDSMCGESSRKKVCAQQAQDYMKLPRILLWFPELLPEYKGKAMLKCPNCHNSKCSTGSCSCTDEMAVRNITWRKVCADHDYYIIVYKRYQCPSCKTTFSTIDQDVRALQPAKIQASFPAILSLKKNGRQAVDKHLFRRLVAECARGNSVKKFRDSLLEVHEQRWLDLEEIYYDRYPTSTEVFEDFVKGIVHHHVIPSLWFLREVLYIEQVKYLLHIYF